VSLRDDDHALAMLLVLALIAFVAVAEVVCHRHHRGGTLSWLGWSGGTEVREIKRAPVLLLLASWYGCYASPDYTPPDLGDASPGVFVRGFAPAGRAPLEVDALMPFDVGPAPAPDAQASPPDTEPPVNLSAPLPAASVAWLMAVPACADYRLRAADACEGFTRNGVRCVECTTFERAPLPAECQSSGACATGEATPLLCVTDCHTSCVRAPRYCPPGGAR
jgi:hypothetical protein